MRCKLLFTVVVASLIAGCEKIPPPEQESLSVKFYDLQGKPLLDVYGNLPIKMVSKQFVRFKEQGIDIKKEGIVVFDKIKMPIDEVGDDFIITRVPYMDYIEPLILGIMLNVRNQVIPLCTVCLPYRPTVRGEILAGFTDGAPDGSFYQPSEMALDAAGNLYVINQLGSLFGVLHDEVLKVTPAGIVSTFAGAGGEFGYLTGIGINPSTNKMYLVDVSANRVIELDMSSPSAVSVLAGSGSFGNTDGMGTSASFRFNRLDVHSFVGEAGQGLALDASGNIYVGEETSFRFGSQIRKISPDGNVTTVPGSRIDPPTYLESASPAGLAVTSSNDIWYVSGSYLKFQGVVKVNSLGSLSRMAGISSYGWNDGFGIAALFSSPRAIATNGTNLYVADAENGALRRVTAAGNVITLAGVGRNNTNSFSGGGTTLPPIEGSWLMPNPLLLTSSDYYEIAASSIRMDQVGGVAVANSGRLIYVSDYGYKCIWKITIR